MTLPRTLAALAVVALTAQANADVWSRATDQEPKNDVYEALMVKGDEAATAAATMSAGLQVQLGQIEVALEAYRAAAKANPRAAEPHYRIGFVLYAFFFDCGLRPNDSRPPPKTCDPKLAREARGREMLQAWDTFEVLAPLDPRVNDLLQTRAIERTKMVAMSANTKSLLEAAERDYKALLARDDGMQRLDAGRLPLVLGNLAETYMMLGDIDPAVETYIAAYRAGADGTTLLGLAVALDRDDRGPQALQLVREFGIQNFENFIKRYSEGEVFFVPQGEEEYYFALCHEAFGNIPESIMHWQAFLRSGAHPKFQPRAKEHLAKLLLRRSVQIDTPVDLGRQQRIEPRISTPPPPPTRKRP